MSHESVTPPYENDRCSGCGASVFDGEECVCDRIDEPPVEHMFEVPGRKLRLMRDTLDAALHVLSCDNWDDDAKAKWFVLTGSREPTTTVLIERLKLALGEQK